MVFSSSNHGVVGLISIDGTKRGCTGVIAQLEKALRDSQIEVFQVIVSDVLTRHDVYEWAKRKGFSVYETKKDDVYLIKLVKIANPNFTVSN